MKNPRLFANSQKLMVKESEIQMPCRLSVSRRCCKWSMSGCVASAKRREESGHPCCTPRVIAMFSVNNPLTCALEKESWLELWIVLEISHLARVSPMCPTSIHVLCDQMLSQNLSRGREEVFCGG